MPLHVVGVEITPQRPTPVFGDNTWVDLAPIENAVFDLGEPTVDVTVSGGRYVQSGSLFVPRGSDLKDGDRVEFQDKIFGVVGDVRWDFNHPFTGFDFGYVEYTVRSGG